MTTDTVDCPLCIDRMTPAGIDPILGPVYQQFTSRQEETAKSRATGGPA